MTAEAVVMNKSAVAMAADSAVTISSGRQGVKTFETVNKLFELVKGQPVGFMVYANAELNGMPWETILKSFREDHRGLRLPHLEDYVEVFETYLKSNGALLDRDSQLHLVVDNSFNALMEVFGYVEDREESCLTKNGRPIMTKVRALIDEAIEVREKAHASWEDSPWSPQLNSTTLDDEFRNAIKILVDELFQQYGLTRATRDRLVELGISFLVKTAPDPAMSGVVFAGFGDRDYFPKMYSSRVRGLLQGHIMEYAVSPIKIERDYPGHLSTFAQDEEAKAYISGVSSQVRDKIVEYWTKWVRDSKREISDFLSGLTDLTEEQKRRVRADFTKFTVSRVKDFLSQMQSHQTNEYLKPFWESISFLPKDELAILAESLVNLTSLKQRMSVRNVATVGGAIDVALISRGDGFIWLKRKHYFKSELNPTWTLTHHGMLDGHKAMTDENKRSAPRKSAKQ
jgi:hypothetical protein